jgi:hypothetical protein
MTPHQSLPLTLHVRFSALSFSFFLLFFLLFISPKISLQERGCHLSMFAAVLWRPGETQPRGRALALRHLGSQPFGQTAHDCRHPSKVERGRQQSQGKGGWVQRVLAVGGFCRGFW